MTTKNEVYGMLTRLNGDMIILKANGRFIVTPEYGKFTIREQGSNNIIRFGLTKTECYDCLYAMARVLETIIYQI
jgi:hypothetical protein